MGRLLTRGIEQLEDRLYLTASLGWDGPGTGATDLTYYIRELPNSIDPVMVQTALATAFDAWSQVAAVTFTLTDRPGRLDSIDIVFTTLDGPGGTLAQAYFPDDVNPARIAGDIYFDLSEAWEIGNSLGSAAYDLVLAAAHEIGHALGVDHSQDADAVMGATVSAQDVFSGLTDDDIAAILSLYAPAEQAAADAADPAPEDTLPEDTLPEDTLPEDTLPEDTLPEDADPDDTDLPQESDDTDLPQESDDTDLPDDADDTDLPDDADDTDLPDDSSDEPADQQPPATDDSVDLPAPHWFHHHHSMPQEGNRDWLPHRHQRSPRDNSDTEFPAPEDMLLLLPPARSVHECAHERHSSVVAGASSPSRSVSRSARPTAVDCLFLVH